MPGLTTSRRTPCSSMPWFSPEPTTTITLTCCFVSLDFSHLCHVELHIFSLFILFLSIRPRKCNSSFSTSSILSFKKRKTLSPFPKFYCLTLLSRCTTNMNSMWPSCASAKSGPLPIPMHTVSWALTSECRWLVNVQTATIGKFIF